MNVSIILKVLYYFVQYLVIIIYGINVGISKPNVSAIFDFDDRKFFLAPSFIDDKEILVFVGKFSYSIDHPVII